MLPIYGVAFTVDPASGEASLMIMVGFAWAVTELPYVVMIVPVASG